MRRPRHASEPGDRRERPAPPTATAAAVCRHARAARVDAADRSPDAAFDARLVRAAQAGLPLSPAPYARLAETLGCTEKRVIERLRAMLEDGRVRRIGAVPDHYRLGYVANGMSVWDVDDALIDAVGARVGALETVSHCYHRSRHPPEWPYNLFAMVHGRTREEVHVKVAAIAELLGTAARAHDVLFSTRILKKTGMRLGGR